MCAPTKSTPATTVPRSPSWSRQCPFALHFSVEPKQLDFKPCCKDYQLCTRARYCSVSGSFSGRWARYYLLPRRGCEDETNAVRCPEPRLAHSKCLLRVHWYGYYWSTALQLSSTHSLSLCGVLAARERIVILPMDEKDFE